ncbi:uncharacterized protein F4822DRAFT_418059 [Hypoxylon trugodes]|uniref:uncharacterized protein n=1 Tax=Hypoxylon trugodes TaxID=326681 RepID=UPI00219AC9BE|nr:uncharacterized protein F4822DRAFT_418059 [Hypoxylon trugodes]KAI1383929.1 hypothetical protein F4822DRAFT_418059 [Hypoxylon trugodes]
MSKTSPSKSYPMDSPFGISRAPTTMTLEAPPPPYSQCLDEGEVNQGRRDVHLRVNVIEDDGSSIRSRNSDARSCSPSIRRNPITPCNPFPQSWSLYRTFPMNKVLMVGAHGREPIYAVSRHSGWWTGKPDLVLHRGPSETMTPLAVGMGGVGIGRHSIIVLTPLPGSGLESSQELMIRVEDDKATDRPQHVRFQFAIETGNELSSQKRETFEWRHTWGDVVAAYLDGARTGWQLVRLTNDQEDQEEIDDSPSIPGPRTEDGLEVVAVWAYSKMNMSKVLKFRYLGSGATGVLGSRWSIMASMTALRMFQRQQKNKHKDW